MMYRCYLSIAGIKILIETDHPIVKNKEFHPFLIDETIVDIHASYEEQEHLSFELERILFTDRGYQIATDSEGNLLKLFYESSEDPVYYAVSVYDSKTGHITVKYLKSYSRCVSEVQNCFYLLGFELILLERNKLCLHASCIETPLGGILFSGVSGIGKSTQAELWCEHRGARQINGDRPILSKENKEWVAWGSPYAGSSRYHVNDKCEITAIVLLKQADSCSVRQLTLMEAFRRIWVGLTIRNWDTSFVTKASSLTIDLISSVPVYEFSCTPDEEAVDYLEKTLWMEKAYECNEE